MNKLSKMNEMMEDLEFVGRECFDWGVRQAWILTVENFVISNLYIFIFYETHFSILSLQ